MISFQKIFGAVIIVGLGLSIYSAIKKVREQNSKIKINSK